jgi:hypothetical protein
LGSTSTPAAGWLAAEAHVSKVKSGTDNVSHFLFEYLTFREYTAGQSVFFR